jgi:hypothetical protein
VAGVGTEAAVDIVGFPENLAKALRLWASCSMTTNGSLETLGRFAVERVVDGD